MQPFLAIITILVSSILLTEAGYIRRNAVSDPSRKWPQGVVPYTFHPGVDAYRRVHVMAAMKQLSLSVYSTEEPCISFVPRTKETDFIEFQFSTLPGGGGGAVVGRAGGNQTVHIEMDITQSNIVQSLMFILGIYPEVSRLDRDNVITIDTSNIPANDQHNFAKEPNTDVFRQAFDYDTIVMYGPYQAAINRTVPTIKAKYEGFTFGQAVSLSFEDARLVQHVYGCPLDASYRIDLLGQKLVECHFHFDFCNLQQDNQDDFDWFLKQGSDTAGTGPAADYSSGSGTYAVAQARNHFGMKARLLSPSLSAGDYCFVMFVFMYGQDMGEMNGYIRDSNGNKKIITVRVQQKPQWYHALVNLSSKNSFQFVLEAVIGNGELGDIAIDDIYIYNGKCIDWY